MSIPNDPGRGPASRVPPPRVEVAEEFETKDGQAVPRFTGNRMVPVPQDFHVQHGYVHDLSRTGMTLDSTFQIDGNTHTLRGLWEIGLLEPLSEETPYGTLYAVSITGRPTKLAVTQKTYETILGLHYDDQGARTELTPEQKFLIEKAVDPKTQEDKQPIRPHPKEGTITP